MNLNPLAPFKWGIDTARINAYTALFNVGLNLQGARRPLQPLVEYTHRPTNDHPLFNDSYYFNFFDQQKRVGGFTRIGKLANEGTAIGILFIYNGDNELLMMVQGESIDRNNDEIRSGLMHYEVVKPLKQLRIVSKGKYLRLKDTSALMDPEKLASEVTDKDFVDVEVDLLFDGRGEVHNFKNFYARGLARRMVEKDFGLKDLLEVRKVASEHYEQVGGYTGVIKIGNRKMEINGAGHRDHSWGLRDWSAPKGWTWLTVQFGKEAALNLSRVQIGRIDMFNGYIFRDGRNFPYRIHELKTEFEPDGITQKRVNFVVEDIGGFRMEVEGRVVNPVPLIVDDGVHRTIVNEALTEYRWDYRRALGISEYLHKIF